jgi:hypothetical protein
MDWKGECRLRIFDVSVSNVKATLIKTEPPGAHCPAELGPDAVADALQSYLVILEGCADKTCECIPVEDGSTRWTDWSTNIVPEGTTIEIRRRVLPADKEIVCTYALTGSYEVSATIVDGICMKKPVSQERLKNSKRPKSEPAKQESAGADLLPRFVLDALKLGGIFYVVGFLVIMVHTNSLRVPVVEAFHFQNILAGAPIGGAICVFYLLYQLRAWLKGPIVSGGEEALKETVAWSLIIILTELLLIPVMLLELRFTWLMEVRTYIGRNFSNYENVILMAGILVSFNICLLVAAYVQKFERGQAVSKVLLAFSLGVLLVIGYTILGYPKLPQSLGGGRPVKVRLYFKSDELSPLLGGSTACEKQAIATGPVYLYYRTSGYLLVSKDLNSDCPLIQVPTDQVRAVEWLESHSKSNVR